MIRFFLHGGYISTPSPENEKFIEEVLTYVRDGARILIVLFARKKESWEEKYHMTQKQFREKQGEKVLHFTLAEVEKIGEQIENSDIIFIHWGQTVRLVDEMSKIENLKQKLQGKIVVGSSAGALFLMNHYYENDTDTYHPGLGIIDAKCICHWSGQHDQLLCLRWLGDPDDEIFTIAEGRGVMRVG